jgi:hypothetical protein
MDPIRVFPYGPAACVKPHITAGHTSAPDHVDRFNEDSSCINGGVHTRSLLANVLSIGFVVRMWRQCSAGKS